jgi:predicted dehydrogenase
MTKTRLRFGLIGCGDFGKELGRYLREVADIVAICDPNPEAMQRTAEVLGLTAPEHTDYRRLIEAGGLDAVAITAANFVHAEITLAAAAAGLHVFCEKAMARTTRECWEMVQACRRNKVKLMVGHKRRLRPAWARMIELTRPDGPLGEPLAITVCGYGDYRPYHIADSWWGDPGLSGGFLHVTDVHTVEWFRGMCGDAASVSAVHGPQHDPRYRFRDILHATYQFKSGALASLAGGMSFPIHKYRESEGPWGECRHGGFKLVPQMNHIDLFWQRLDEAQPHHERFEDLGFDHAFRKEVGDMVHWIAKDRQPCLTWVEGLRCVEMMEAAHRSATAGGVRLSLPLHPEFEHEH